MPRNGSPSPLATFSTPSPSAAHFPLLLACLSASLLPLQLSLALPYGLESALHDSFPPLSRGAGTPPTQTVPQIKSFALPDGPLRPPGAAAESSPVVLRQAQGSTDPLSEYEVTEEVSKPIVAPRRVSPCMVTLLKDQNFSAFLAPVKVSYKPPSANRCGTTWQLVVLRFFSHVKGVQFDRRFTFKLDDVMLMVGTTAEPKGSSSPGTKFSTERDITHLQSILKSSKSGVFQLPNVVNTNYTGIFYVTLQLKFYKGTPPAGIPDMVLPAPGRRLRIPQNVYQAKLEVYVSHYQTDEFYWFNVPDSYYQTLSPEQQQTQSNGSSFREVVALLDGKPVGAIFHKPTLYSGALNPPFWSDFMGIGSLNMLLYTVDITPFVGTLVDGSRHSISFQVTNAAKGSLWITDGALLLWTDPKRTKTTGSITSRNFGSLSLTETASANGTLTSVITAVGSRSYEFSGVVESSFGSIATGVSGNMNFRNVISLSRGANFQNAEYRAATSSIVRKFNGTGRGRQWLSEERLSVSYPLQALFDFVPYPDDTGYIRIVHAVLSEAQHESRTRNATEQIQNIQTASAYGSTKNGAFYLQSTAQDLTVVASPGDGCYSRRVKTTARPNNTTGALTTTIEANTTTDPCAT